MVYVFLFLAAAVSAIEGNIYARKDVRYLQEKDPTFDQVGTNMSDDRSGAWRPTFSFSEMWRRMHVIVGADGGSALIVKGGTGTTTAAGGESTLTGAEAARESTSTAEAARAAEFACWPFPPEVLDPLGMNKFREEPFAFVYGPKEGDSVLRDDSHGDFALKVVNRAQYSESLPLEHLQTEVAIMIKMGEKHSTYSHNAYVYTDVHALDKFIDACKGDSLYKPIEGQGLQKYTEQAGQDGLALLPMPMYSGDLRNLLPGPQAGLHPSLAAGILLQILDGVERLHTEGYLHNDLKVENILWRSTGGDGLPSVVVAGYGYASHIAEGWNEERGGVKFGTHVNMAPEIHLRQEDENDDDNVLTTKSDYWSIGVILYEMLKGKHPFPADVLAGGDDGFITHERWGDVITDRVLSEFQGRNSVDSLIQGLLAREIKDRLELIQIVKHPWVTENAQGRVLTDLLTDLQNRASAGDEAPVSAGDAAPVSAGNEAPVSKGDAAAAASAVAAVTLDIDNMVGEEIQTKAEGAELGEMLSVKGEYTDRLKETYSANVSVGGFIFRRVKKEVCETMIHLTRLQDHHYVIRTYKSQATYCIMEDLKSLQNCDGSLIRDLETWSVPVLAKALGSVAQAMGFLAKNGVSMAEFQPEVFLMSCFWMCKDGKVILRHFLERNLVTEVQTVELLATAVATGYAHFFLQIIEVAYFANDETDGGELGQYMERLPEHLVKHLAQSPTKEDLGTRLHNFGTSIIEATGDAADVQKASTMKEFAGAFFDFSGKPFSS